MNREEIIKRIQIARELARRQEEKKFWYMWDKFYEWQTGFITDTANYREVCLMAANRVGKTYTGTYIDAAHAMGEYPEGWTGHKFSHAPLIWCLGYSGDKCRDLLQTPLFGHLQDGKFTGGLVPRDMIVDYIPSGTSRLAQTVFVKHSSGHLSKVQFWSYSQGQHALMGDSVDWFHIDEEPKDQTIRPQVLTRTASGDMGKGGRGIYTFTPENGRTDTVIQFMDKPTAQQRLITIGWDNAPHLTEETKQALLEAFPPHQRDMRTKGIPMLGHGRIFDLSEEFVSCEPFDIPEHWFVIDGMDFGWDHPQAHIQLVEDRDNGVFYVTHAWKARQVSPDNARGAVKEWCKDVPVAWPLDGLQTEKGSGKQQKRYYEDAGFTMLGKYATWPDGSNGVEAGLFEMLDLMQKGKFKVFKGLRSFFDEFNMYHRDDKGKIAKTNDDVLDAVRYAYMMRRHAIRFGDTGGNKSETNGNTIQFY